MDILHFVVLASITSQCLASYCANKKSCCTGTLEHDLCKVDDHTSSCFCDSKCMIRGDCCSDYKTFCLQGKPEPCIYNLWSSWTTCSSQSKCSIGYKTRERTILQTGNERSNQPCNFADLIESSQCGDRSCHTFKMERVTDLSQYEHDHFHFTNAVYTFERNKQSDCDQFKPSITSICILCEDENTCGENIIKENDTIDILYGRCHGIWRKTTSSFYKRTCSYMLPYREHFSFT